MLPAEGRQNNRRRRPRLRPHPKGQGGILNMRRGLSTCVTRQTQRIYMHASLQGPDDIYQLVQACVIVSIVQFSESFWFPSK